ncbi:MAG: 2,3-bisphosphoglycerate-independent phosphoglycerate mutase, partial [Lysobacterales bacterium]
MVLLILDGWGARAEREWNAIAQADCPNWGALMAECPHTLIDTHGLRVGLPEGQMGNSEVGHMNIGAGRVVYQELTRIDETIRDLSFFENPALRRAIEVASRPGATLHVLGLLSPGGVHSHEDHILAMLDLAAGAGVASIAVHAMLDGRDTPPQSAPASVERLAARIASIAGARIASLSGRYFAMDRDQRWDRVERAFRAIADGDSPLHAPDVRTALTDAYARGETDEFVQPVVIDRGAPGRHGAPIRDGDAVVFMNFRADRARELTAAFVREKFDSFARPRRPALGAFVSLTRYAHADDLPVSAVAFESDALANTLGEFVAERGLKQLRIAETEKYAHVTFFFNGGREQPFSGEERILVPSPRVATYDLKPEMSCPELTARLTAAIRARTFDLIVCNIANPDMVGHTGIFAAAIKAAEAVDVALGEARAAIEEVGGAMLVTADHGNLELMQDENG